MGYRNTHPSGIESSEEEFLRFQLLALVVLSSLPKECKFWTLKGLLIRRWHGEEGVWVGNEALPLPSPEIRGKLIWGCVLT